jgi:hypothetical protein
MGYSSVKLAVVYGIEIVMAQQIYIRYVIMLSEVRIDQHIYAEVILQVYLTIHQNHNLHKSAKSKPW